MTGDTSFVVQYPAQKDMVVVFLETRAERVVHTKLYTKKTTTIMSSKAVREYHGKKLIARHVREISEGKHVIDDRSALVGPTTDLVELAAEEPWLLSTPLVVKPDQLIKRRGKAGLVGLNLNWTDVQSWIAERMEKEIQVGHVSGHLDHFIVDPFVTHDQSDEYYVCIQSDREGEELLFYAQGGVDVGDVDSKASRLHVPLGEPLTMETMASMNLLAGVPDSRTENLASFLLTLFKVYRMLNFTYMEINPIVFTDDGKIIPLDLAAKIDETAVFLNATQWGHLDFPAPFGRREFPEEAYIRELDSKTGASLKLTILNLKGRIWTMVRNVQHGIILMDAITITNISYPYLCLDEQVAGGGASVVYADTICDLGFAHELANYGEYSGAPSMEHTFEYAKTLIGLMTREKDPRGKIFIVGGSIANFTDVSATFTGLIKAIKAFSDVIKSHNVSLHSMLTCFILGITLPNSSLFTCHRLRYGCVERVQIIKKACK